MARRKKFSTDPNFQQTVMRITNSTTLTAEEKVNKIKLYTEIDSKVKEIERHKTIIESSNNKINILAKEIEGIQNELKNIK